MKAPPLKIAPLICFEDTLASVADKAALLRPDAFITITNDGWYTGIYARWGGRQHLNHAVFRCVEHDLPMIRCANTGISCVINEDGTVVQRFIGPAGGDLDVGGIFTGQLLHYARGPGTVYERWGDWIVLLSSLVTVMLGVRFLVQPAR
jgi:apolipoprotein N-acyltransferase